MNTIQPSFSVLRGIILAGLGAAALWAAAPAHAIDASNAARQGQQTSEAKSLPAPVLVAPLLLAGGEPPVVVDSWWRRLFG